MAESFRNEVDIQLGGETRTMRATFVAIRAIERELGKGIMVLLKSIDSISDLSISDSAVIIYHGLRGYGDTSMTIEQVGEALLAEGFIKSAVPVIEFLGIALKGPEMGKPQPETAAQ